MRDHGLCRPLFESCHAFPSGTVLKSFWTACGILSLFLWTTNCAKAALPQEPRLRSEKLESQRKALENLAEYFPDYRISLSDGDLEKLLNEVERRFNEADLDPQDETVLERLQGVIRNEQLWRETTEQLRWYPIPDRADLEPIKEPTTTPSGTESPIGKATRKRKAIFLDVRSKAGIRFVTARTESEFLLQKAGFKKVGKGKGRYVSSIDKLDQVVGDAERVFLGGEGLPRDWTNHLQKNHDLVWSSNHSPKNTPEEYTLSANLLERRAESGKTRVFSALPQGGSEEELKIMKLDETEAEEWKKLGEGIDEVQKESKIEIEPATKEAVLRELGGGSKDTIILFGHAADCEMCLRGGETITKDDVSANERPTAPERSVIFITCEAGKVNTRRQSLSEAILAGKKAATVIAHPEPISAKDIPKMLRELLIEGKSFKEVFTPRGYVPISESLGDGLKPEAVRLVGYGFFLDLAEGKPLKLRQSYPNMWADLISGSSKHVEQQLLQATL